MCPKLQDMARIISKSYPVNQAKREALWISQELPKQKWLNACNLRSQLMPLQYILGNQPFGKLDIKCKSGVLIPRLDTEEWVLEATDLLKNTKIDNVVDYCTGSGCIGLGFASELNQIKKVDCIDFKDDAVALSKVNLNSNKESIISNVEIHKGNLFDGYLPPILENSISILVSNPPYIPLKDMTKTEVEESVLTYEPKEALIGDLEFYEALCNEIISKNESFQGFIFELGYIHQADLVKQLLNDNSWIVGIRYDRSEHLRNVLGWKKNSGFNVLQKMVHKYL